MFVSVVLLIQHYYKEGLFPVHIKYDNHTLPVVSTYNPKLAIYHFGRM